MFFEHPSSRGGLEEERREIIDVSRAVSNGIYGE